MEDEPIRLAEPRVSNFKTSDVVLHDGIVLEKV